MSQTPQTAEFDYAPPPCGHPPEFNCDQYGCPPQAETAPVRNLATEVVGADYPDAYLYVGSGDHIVLLCDKDAPKWKNAVMLTPDNARRLAADLISMADQSEMVIPPGQETDR